jgi:FSR family fosmidomycin resistance protein-like MFS transporter
MRTAKNSLFAYTFAHFCTDFCCVATVLALLAHTPSSSERFFAIIAYNVIAFGLQMPLGALLDKFSSVPAALIGFLLITIGSVLLPMAINADLVVLIVLCVGVGNAAFHVEGGIDSLSHAAHRFSRSGIFVSTGALGVVGGSLAGSAGTSTQLLVLLCSLMVLSALCVAFFKMKPQSTEKTDFGTANFESGRGVGRAAANQSAHRGVGQSATALCVALLFIAVLIRSVGGSLIQMPWREQIILLPACAAFLGKAAGGFLADTWGARRVGVTSLVISIPLLALSIISPACAALGTICFNIAMPITLCALSDRFPGRPGLAFGSASMALVVGSLPLFFLNLPPLLAIFLLALLTLVAALALFAAVADKTPTDSQLMLPDAHKDTVR